MDESRDVDGIIADRQTLQQSLGLDRKRFMDVPPFSCVEVKPLLPQVPVTNLKKNLRFATTTFKTTSAPTPQDPVPLLSAVHEILSAGKGAPEMTERQKRRMEARRLAKKENKEISQAQLAANQANAQLSTGPTSGEGKAISAQNNFRHGLTQTEGDLTFLEGESKEAYAKTLSGFQKEWKPATETEHDLVERLATRQWLRRRAFKLQQQFLAPDGTILDQKQFALYNRYETQHERAYNKALSDLMRLKSLRLREQNGFESQRRKDEVHAFKIKALQDREYRNKLQILEREARLTLAQAKLNTEHLMDVAPNLTHSEESARQASR